MPSFDYLRDYDSVNPPKTLDLTKKEIQEMIMKKCYGVGVYKDGLYYQTCAFAPLIGLMKSTRKANVTLYMPNKHQVFVFANKQLDAGEALQVQCYVNHDIPLNMWLRYNIFTMEGPTAIEIDYVPNF